MTSESEPSFNHEADEHIDTSMISEPVVTIHPEQQKTENPENNLINGLDRLFYLAKQVTRSSKTDGITRPLSHRRNRANILKEIQQLDRHDPVQRQQVLNLLEQANDNDEILTDYLNQGEIAVEIPGMGTQKASYTTIAPPESQTSLENTKQAPPIVVLGGISNALQAMQPFTEEIALQGRNVITFGYPEDPMGSVTQEFADQVTDGDPFDAHAQFYKHAIAEMQQQGIIPPTFDLWGYSTGAAIAAHMLNNPEISDMVEHAAFVCPAGATDQSLIASAKGVLHDYARTVKKFGDLSRYSYITPRKEENTAMKARTFKGLIAHVGKKHDASYQNARVRPGGSIAVLTENDDQVTKSFGERQMFLQNPQATIIEDSGFHFTPLLEAPRVVASLLEKSQK